VQTVRRHIAEILKEDGSATVAQLAEMLGMAQVSVRHHLDILVGEDLVELVGVRRRSGAGRPSQVYALTPNAARLFPQRHEALANNMLAELKASLPSSELRAILQRVATKTAQQAPPAGPDQPIEERLDEVAAFLTDQGYNARWEMQDGCFELHACNCPFSGVSDQNPELCAMDQAMMQRLLPTAVRQQSRVMDGASRCTYVIRLAPATAEEA
jgi:predicted ArsR family transcriptional regulator